MVVTSGALLSIPKLSEYIQNNKWRMAEALSVPSTLRIPHVFLPAVTQRDVPLQEIPLFFVLVTQSKSPSFTWSKHLQVRVLAMVERKCLYSSKQHIMHWQPKLTVM